MLNEGLSNITVVSIHASRSKSIDLDKVLNRYVSFYPNCRIELTI